MNTLTKVALIIIGLAVLLLGGFFWLNNYIYTEKQAEETVPEFAAYFQERLVTLGVERMGQPIEGFDPSILMMAFPGFTASDFDGVAAFEGHYQFTGGELEMIYTNQQMMTSAAGTVSSEGYITLLENVAARLSIPATDEERVDEIIRHLSEDGRQ